MELVIGYATARCEHAALSRRLRVDEVAMPEALQLCNITGGHDLIKCRPEVGHISGVYLRADILCEWAP